MERPGTFARTRDALDVLARRHPARLALATFAAVVALVAVLLSFPWATSSGVRAPLVDAVFTATSAVCITGLTVVDTATYWSGYGQVVILAGIQVGGFGVMTLASILGFAVSGRLGLTQRMLTASETKTTRLGEVGSLVRAVIATSLVVEVALIAALFPRFLALGQDVGEALWNATFYGISIFNNAGFVNTPGGLYPFVGDAWINIPVVLGAFIGALGFPVILVIARSWRSPKQWTLHAKITITASTALALLATVVIGLLEWSNPRTFGELPVSHRILATIMAGVTPRSSGFATVDVGEMREATWLLQDALMFVGGGSASTGGGIKVTTLAVMLLAIGAEARGDRDVEAFGRRVPPDTLRLAVAVTFIGATAVLLASLVLLSMTDLRLDVILFEAISAFATCGLSTGITPSLPDEAKYLLSGLMFAGRTGTMTVAAALAARSRLRVVRQPEERPIIG